LWPVPTDFPSMPNACRHSLLFARKSTVDRAHHHPPGFVPGSSRQSRQAGERPHGARAIVAQALHRRDAKSPSSGAKARSGVLQTRSLAPGASKEILMSQGRRGGHAGARDAGALLRRLHLLLDAPGAVVGVGRSSALAALPPHPLERCTTRTPPQGISRAPCQEDNSHPHPNQVHSSGTRRFSPSQRIAGVTEAPCRSSPAGAIPSAARPART